MRIHADLFRRYAASPEAFRNDLVIDVNGIARRFGAAMDSWQRDDFKALDPALMHCNGQMPERQGTFPQRAYLERARGHSKSTDLAVTCSWALAFSTRPIMGFAFAADQEQAKILKNAVETLCRLNPWLGGILEVKKDCVENKAIKHPGKGSKLIISTSDVASSYGILPDLIIADELTHWEGDGSLWHSLISSAAKRSNCLLAVISNAGYADSWQWNVREAARTDEAWLFSRLEGAQASWMTPDRLEEQRRMLPAVAYARLWLNEWASGGGDALLPADIAACFHDDLTQMTGNEPGWKFVAGVDLGLTRDCSAVVVLGIPDKRYGKVRLARHKVWKPARDNKLEISDVEKYILAVDQEFDLQAVGYDPWQAELLAQRLELHSDRYRRSQRKFHWSKPWMQRVQPTAAILREIAGLVIEYIGDHRLEAYPCHALRSDLIKLRVEEKSYGYRLTSPRDDTGHGDVASAFCNALLIGHKLTTETDTVAGAPEGPSLTPLQRAIADTEARNERFQDEQRAWAEEDDGKEGLRQLITALGGRKRL